MAGWRAAPTPPRSHGKSSGWARSDVTTVRRRLNPYRNGAIPATAPSPHLTVRRITDWIMRRPEHLTDLEQKSLDELCERNRALATTVEYARRLARMIRTRRSEHLALDVRIADVRLDGQRELRTLANDMRRDRAAIKAALATTYTSGAVEGNVTRIKLAAASGRPARVGRDCSATSLPWRWVTLVHPSANRRSR
ncbi:transposase [Streptomyces sp. CA-243310]|uniref:transposase n=1 Tax=Streptomyces sp. CA-243310 TaxID=3240056 RepID=UPI003D93F654